MSTYEYRAYLNLFTTTVIGCLLLLLLFAGAGNVNMSNGLLRAMLELPCVVYHRLRGSRTLERRSIVCSAVRSKAIRLGTKSQVF